MYIHEAVSAALAKGIRIKRTSPIWKQLEIEPTNSSMGCILHSPTKAPCPWWQPQAEDLMADDWILVPEN